HFFFALPGEDEKAIADEQRRRVPEADLDPPLLLQAVGPSRRLAKRRHGAVAIRSAPLRPVLSGGLSTENDRPEDGAQARSPKALMGCDHRRPTLSCEIRRLDSCSCLSNCWSRPSSWPSW